MNSKQKTINRYFSLNAQELVSAYAHEGCFLFFDYCSAPERGTA